MPDISIVMQDISLFYLVSVLKLKYEKLRQQSNYDTNGGKA